jgi:hypothetical protein
MSTFDIPIAGPSKNVPQDDPAYTFNLYPETVSEGIYTLKPAPGNVASTALTGLAGGRSNGLSVGGRLFGIRGNFFCEVVAGASVIRGSLTSTQGLCGLTSCLPPNGDGQILIVGPNDGEGYVFELATNTFTKLTEATHGFVGGRGQTCFLGGRAYAIKPGTGQFQASELYNFLNWPGDAFGTAEFDSDELIAIDTDGNYLLLFGTKTLEVWAQTNSLPLPVNPTSNTASIGILSPHAHCVYNDTFYWLGGNVDGSGVFYRMRGTGIPEPISDYSISRNVAAIADPDDAVMYSYQSLGHPFILTTFFVGKKTFVYDVGEKMWHMRGQRLVPSNNEAALPWLGMIVHNGQLLALSKNGRFYEIRDDVYTDDGNPIVRRRILSVIPKEASWKSYYQSVELFGEMGNAPFSSDGIRSVMLSISRDRGKTYGTEMWRNMSGNGSYVCRARWTGLGSAFGFVLKFETVTNNYISWRGVRVEAE